MKRLLLLLAIAVKCYGSACVGAVTGDWATAGTWTSCAGGVPGAGDTINITDGITVTVSDDRSFGTSGVAGTIDAVLNNTGAIVIAGGGGILRARGGFSTHATGGNFFVHLKVSAGAIFEWDATHAVTPSTAIYFYGNPTTFEFSSRVWFAGTSGNHATVRSNVTGGAAAGRWWSGNTSTPGILATYTDFLNIGDATHSAFDLYGGYLGVQWNVQTSTFTSCGVIENNNSGAGLVADSVFIHDYNVHVNSVAGQIFNLWATDNATVGAGTREIKGNVFDTLMASAFFYPGGFTISGNYFANATFTEGPFGSGSTWAACDSNFIRFDDSWGFGSHMRVDGNMTNPYVFIDSNWGNPKPLGGNQDITSSITGAIVGQAGTAMGPPGNNDSGEFTFDTEPPTVQTYGLFNSILLPNMNGYSSMEMGSPTIGIPNMRVQADHNTWFGGWLRAVPCTNATICFGPLDMGEGGNNITQVVTSFRSNILWNPQLSGYPGGFFKLTDVSGNAIPTVDYCTTTTCDYNAGWGHNATTTPTGGGTPTGGSVLVGYVNSGRGYAGAFTATPGVHDVDVDPMFVDYRRTVELYDTKGLHNTAPAWSSPATYAIGDMVSSADLTVPSTIYWGMTVNFRYINSTYFGMSACGGANPKPGVGTNWRSCWEWATLYRIRNDIAIRGAASTMIADIIAWVKAGYAPTNPLLHNTGYMGTDIGAVPWQSAGPQFVSINNPLD